MSWMQEYREYTGKSESPDVFHTWCGISALCSCLGRKVWMNMGYFNIYANMFIVLIGPPGSRKTTAIRISTDLLVNDPEIKVSADSTTREALIRSLKTSETMITDSKGEIYTHSSLTIVSEELSVFLGKYNMDLLSLLTNLYDCKNVWEYRTKNMGTDTIYGEWLHMLAASAPKWLIECIPSSAIGGGFTSRIIFVVGDEPRFKSAIPEISSEILVIKKSLLKEIARVRNLFGEIKFAPQARAWYISWYENQDKKLGSDPRFAGYADRKHIHVLKLAMVLSVSESSNLVLEQRHLELALQHIDFLEDKMVDAFGSVGRSLLAPDIDAVIQYMSRFKTATRKDLVRSIWRDVNPRDTDVVLKTLQDMGVVKISFRNGISYYEYIEQEKEGSEG